MEYFATRTAATLIAEGIETARERRTLAQLGVTLGQGYLLGKPAEAVVRNGRATSLPSLESRGRRSITPAAVARTRG